MKFWPSEPTTLDIGIENWTKGKKTWTDAPKAAPKAKDAGGEFISGAIVFVVGSAVAVGMVWGAISVVRWMWQHPIVGG